MSRRLVSASEMGALGRFLLFSPTGGVPAIRWLFTLSYANARSVSACYPHHEPAEGVSWHDLAFYACLRAKLVGADRYQYSLGPIPVAEMDQTWLIAANEAMSVLEYNLDDLTPAETRVFDKTQAAFYQACDLWREIHEKKRARPKARSKRRKGSGRDAGSPADESR